MNRVTNSYDWISHFNHCVMPEGQLVVLRGSIVAFIDNTTIRRARAVCGACGLVSIEPIDDNNIIERLNPL